MGGHDPWIMAAFSVRGEWYDDKGHAKILQKEDFLVCHHLHRCGDSEFYPSAADAW